MIESLRIHIDKILPVYSDDVAVGWFDTLPDKVKNLMHPLDRTNPPTGPGWIIQVVGHHYNPPPDAAELKKPLSQRTKFGPLTYLYEKVIPYFNSPSLRQFGVHHVALAWDDLR